MFIKIINVYYRLINYSNSFAIKTTWYLDLSATRILITVTVLLLRPLGI